jgi:hypothetical protein
VDKLYDPFNPDYDDDEQLMLVVEQVRFFLVWFSCNLSYAFPANCRSGRHCRVC